MRWRRFKRMCHIIWNVFTADMFCCTKVDVMYKGRCVMIMCRCGRVW